MNDVERASNQGISRRTVAKAMAWSAPVIAVAATVPVVAASCTDTTSFDDLEPGTKPTTLTFEPSGVTATLSFARKNSQVDMGATGRVARTSTNPRWNYLEMQLADSVREGDWIELTIDLSEPVSGLSFIIHDIDKSDWHDTVQVWPAGFTSARGSNITGDGTASNRFRPINYGDTPINEGAGRVRVTWSGEVQTIKVRYVAGWGSQSNQHIGIGDLSYDSCVPNTGAGAGKARSLARVAPRVSIDAQAEVPAPSDAKAVIDS